MNRFENICKKPLLTALLLAAALGSQCQEATQAAPAPEQGGNLLATLMIITMIVLAIIIWGMGQALVGISKLALDKYRNETKIIALLLFSGLSMYSNSAYAQQTEAAAAYAANYGGISANTFYALAGVLMVEVLAIIFLAFSIRRVYQELVPETEKAARPGFMNSWWDNLDKKFFTKAVPVEKEADVLLDHDYDGIRELDNALPPWWKYGFYFTILVGILYLFLYHVTGDGKNPTQEYAMEMEKARIQKEIFEAGNKDKIDEKNVPMADAAGIAKGKDIYQNKCWACHGKLGEGGAGPNLTDDYWIHKGSMNDIYQSIKVGYPEKGMQSWAKEFTPKEMSLVSSYIKTMRGTNPPNGKAPQGDLFSEAPANGSDSTAVKTDTTTTAKAAVQ
jgi:cytochrome c oxidase cbb3-type subunit 3